MEHRKGGLQDLFGSFSNKPNVLTPSLLPRKSLKVKDYGWSCLCLSTRRKRKQWGCHQHQCKEVCVLLQTKWTLGKEPVCVSFKETLRKMAAWKCRVTSKGRVSAEWSIRDWHEGGSLYGHIEESIVYLRNCIRGPQREKSPKILWVWGDHTRVSQHPIGC